MKQSEERVFLLALLLSGRVSWRRAVTDVLEANSAHRALVNALGHTDALFELEKDPMESALAAARELVAWCASNDVGVHAFREDGYPLQLRDVHEMPPVVFTRGTVLPDERRAIAVVGSRRASPRGLEVARNIAGQLTHEHITVVSGLAAGIDAMAHRTALGLGGRTVAVIGTGIDRHYPPENRDLQEEIAARGLVLSQFLPRTAPAKQNFPMRNAVMSGYAAATIVVEAGEHSGARIQARMALQHGRPVIMPEELLVNTWAREYALRPGVHVVGGIADLMDTVNSVLADADVAPEDLVEDSALVW